MFCNKPKKTRLTLCNKWQKKGTRKLLSVKFCRDFYGVCQNVRILDKNGEGQGDSRQRVFVKPHQVRIQLYNIIFAITMSKPEYKR